MTISSSQRTTQRNHTASQAADVEATRLGGALVDDEALADAVIRRAQMVGEVVEEVLGEVVWKRGGR